LKILEKSAYFKDSLKITLIFMPPKFTTITQNKHMFICSHVELMCSLCFTTHPIAVIANEFGCGVIL
jgi:hypothetical protein